MTSPGAFVTGEKHHKDGEKLKSLPATRYYYFFLTSISVNTTIVVNNLYDRRVDVS